MPIVLMLTRLQKISHDDHAGIRVAEITGLLLNTPTKHMGMLCLEPDFSLSWLTYIMSERRYKSEQVSGSVVVG